MYRETIWEVNMEYMPEKEIQHVIVAATNSQSSLPG